MAERALSVSASVRDWAARAPDRVCLTFHAGDAIAERLTYSEIAADLYLSLNTVKTHLRHAYMKLGVTSRSSAVKRATSLGIL